MYRLFVSCFFLINIAPKLFSPYMALDSADGALIRGFSISKLSVDIKDTRFTFFSLVFLGALTSATLSMLNTFRGRGRPELKFSIKHKPAHACKTHRDKIHFL